MAFIPTPDCVVVELVFNCYGQICENTLAFKRDLGPPSLEDMGILADEIIAWYGSHRAAATSTNCDLIRVVTTDQSSDSAPSITTIPAPIDGNGQATFACPPNNVALCVSFRTAGRGRSARGRNYVMGFPSDAVNGNDIDVTYSAAVVTHYAALKSEVQDLGWTWVVISKQHNKVKLTVGNPQPVQIAIITDLHLDSQRRRLTGRGT